MTSKFLLGRVFISDGLTVSCTFCPFPVGFGIPAQSHPAFSTPTPLSQLMVEPSSLVVAVPMATNVLRS